MQSYHRLVSPGAIRTALIGYGLAGRVFHAPLISSTPGMHLTTIVTSDPGRQASAAHDHPGVGIADRTARVWGRVEDHDLVVIAAPNRHHVALAQAGLDAGLAVVIDKPMAATAREARMLVELARRRGLLLTVFHNRRWDAEILTVRRLLAEGVLGRIVRVESRYDRWRPQVTGAWRDSADVAEAGGLLLDLGTHLIDQALHLFGWPQHVYAELDRHRDGAAVEDDVFVALGYSSGLRVHLWASVLAAAPTIRLRVMGTDGSYLREVLDVQEDALRAGARPGDATWGREPPELWGQIVDKSGSRVVESEPGAWPRFYIELVAALHGAGAVPVPPEEAVAVLEVIEAARQSAVGGAVVRLAGRDVGY